MQRARAFLTLFLLFATVSLVLVACDSGALDETPAAETPEGPPATPEDGEVPGANETSEPDGELEDSQATESSNPGLTAVIVSGGSAGAGKPFTFDATQSDPGSLEIVHYQWNMGDGTTLFGNSVQHAFDEPGFYTVTLTVTDEEGNVDVTAQVVEIVDLDEEPPQASGDEVTLVGTKWTLNYPMRGTTLTLEFSDVSIGGSTGCNTYTANYTAAVTEGTSADISVSGIRITSSNLCTYEIMAQEDGFMKSLESASSITVDGQTLTLETGSGTLTFSQVEAAQ